MRVDYDVFPIATSGVLQYDYLKLSDTQGVCSAHDGFFITDGNEAVNNSINYCGTRVGLGEAFNGMCYCGDSNDPFVPNNLPVTIKSVRLVSPSVYSTEAMPYAINGGQANPTLSFLNRNVIGNKRFVVLLDPHAFIYYVTVLLFDRQYLTQGTQYPTISIPYDNFTAENYSENLINNGYDDNYVCIGFEVVCYHGMSGTERVETNYPVLPEIEFDFPPTGTEHRIMYGGIYRHGLLDWYAYAQKRQATGSKQYFDLMANWYGGYARSNYRFPCVLTNRQPPDTYASTNTYINMSDFPVESDAGVYDGYMIANWSGTVTFASIYNKEKIQQMLSITGLFWTGDETTAKTCDLERSIPDNVHIGEMVDGITTGVTLSGLDCRDTEQFDYDDIINQTTYEAVDPSDPPEPEPPSDDNPTTSGGDDHLPRRGFSIGGTGGFVTQYALSYSQLHEFANMLWAQFGDADFISNIGTTFLNDYSIKPSDILNYIVSMRVYPFNLADSVSYTDTQSANIFIGRGVFPYILTTGNTHVIADTCETFDGGYCDVPTYYNDFRDYEPASSIEVYVPFCGSVSVAPSEVVGKRLRLTYGVDYSTGALSATLWVISDTNYTLAVLSGQVAASIQMSASNEMDGILRLTSIATTIGKAMLTDDKVDASKLSDTAKNAAKTSNALGMTSDLVNSVGSGLPVHSIGNTNGFSNFATPPRACITISYHKYKNPQNFAHVYGYKCNRRETLSSLNGYTKCKNVDVSGFTCHEDERSEIKALLESGVYL